MLVKKNKFTKSDFDKIRQNTKERLNTPFGLVYIMKTDFAKSTIVIPKKVYKKANERNKVKRIFYRSLINNKTSDDLNNQNNLHLAVFIKSKLSPLQFSLELVKIIQILKTNSK